MSVHRLTTLLSSLLIVFFAHARQELWWSYYPQDAASAFATGDGVAQTYHAAIRMPAHYAVPDGGQLEGVRFRLTTHRISDVKVWVSSTLPEGSDGDLLTQAVAESDYDADSKMYVLRFSSPVTIPADGCYIGFSFKVPEISADATQKVYDSNPLCYISEEVPQRDAFYIRSDKFPYWENYGIMGKSLIMQVLLGGQLFENAVRPADFGTHQAIHGETVSVPVTLRNFGTAAVSSIDYAIDTRSRKGEEKHLDLSSPLAGNGSKAIVEFPFETDTYTGNVKKTLRITKVNGVANETEAQATGALFEMTRRVEPRLLFEEYTGTWCVNCPRGMVGVEMLHHDFGERIVTMAVHNGDPMALSDYDFTMSLVKGYPSALINRNLELDPYYGTSSNTPYAVHDDVERLLQGAKAPAELNVQAAWNSDSTNIDITSRTTFLFDSNNANYALGYVLLADSLHNNASGWLQKNGYADLAGSIDDPNLLPWTLLPGWVPNLRFNHVPIATSGVQKGISASVKAPLKAEESQTHTRAINIADNSLVQDKKLLRVAVLLFDTQSGLVVNATECPILSADDISGIESLPHSSINAPRIYDLQGRPANQNGSRGIIIMRNADGTSRKVLR